MFMDAKLTRLLALEADAIRWCEGLPESWDYSTVCGRIDQVSEFTFNDAEATLAAYYDEISAPPEDFTNIAD